MDFSRQEATDGIRFTWNNWPPTKLTATRNLIPLGCLYTPLKEIQNLQLVEYDPVKCRCGVILNPHCQVDFISKLWICPFCNVRNAFPPHYAQHISDTTLPVELIEEFTTMEYVLPSQQNNTPPVILWVIDTCMIESELQSVKDSLLQVLNTLSEEVIIGIITFGAHCFVHELSDKPKQYAFQGTKEVTTPMIISQLWFENLGGPRDVKSNQKQFLRPMAECEYIIGQIIEEIEPDPWPVASDSRPFRCVGTAISAGLSLLEATYPGQGARLMLVLGGAATIGPGMIVSEKLADQIRTYLDIKNDTHKYSKKAAKFYEAQAQKAVRTGHSVDLFNCSLDQSGLLEMRNLVEKTGGHFVVHDTFEKQVFKDSFLRVFQREATGSFKMAFNGRMEMFLSRDVKVCGCIGPCLSEKKKSPLVSETEIGESQTVQWFMPSLDNNSTYAFYLDITAQPNVAPQPGRRAYVQFQTRYQHSSGRTRLRVTTCSFKYADQNSISEYIKGFDQETAAVLMARYAVLRTESEEHIEVLR